jgi:acetylornithine deacetylase
MALSDLERDVVADIGRRREEIVALASDLIRFDTTARTPGERPRDEEALQRFLAERLLAAGAAVDLFEPDPRSLAGKPLVPQGLDFEGRPQLVARFVGVGGGRSLLLNGHVDVVPADPPDGWSSPPFAPEVRDGRLYGRGACDMKGGIAAMVLAAEVLARRGVLAGDLVVATNTDEESSGAGGMSLVAHGVRADGAIVTEPTGFDVWISCRGSSYFTLVVPGRAGHAEVAQPDWREGGAVNAIEKAVPVLNGLRLLGERWAADPALRHPRLASPSVVPTIITAGDWPVTIPGEARLTVAVTFLPAQADPHGWGSNVEQEVADAVAQICSADDWLALNPVRVDIDPNPVMPLEIPPDTPIVRAVTAAAADVAGHGRLGGLDSWYDGATFTLLADTPAVGFGPGGFETAHAVDEYVPIEDLVTCAQTLAVAALRFCGTAA